MGEEGQEFRCLVKLLRENFLVGPNFIFSNEINLHIIVAYHLTRTTKRGQEVGILKSTSNPNPSIINPVSPWANPTTCLGLSFLVYKKGAKM